MHDKARRHRHEPHVLDPGDAQAVHGFLLRTAIFGTYALLPWLFGLCPSGDVSTRLLMLFSVGGLFETVIALFLGEKAGCGKLNHWDEAMAFNGLALLMRLIYG